MGSHNRSKLPLTANWWRNGEKLKQNSKDYVHSESLESTSEINLPNEELNKIPEEFAMPKETTLDQNGIIDTSKAFESKQLSNLNEIYEDMCDKLNCPSSKRFIKTLKKISAGSTVKNIDMAHYGLTDQGLRAIILSNITQFSSFNLQDNLISERSLINLISALKRNQITELNLSGANLTKFGSKILSTWISSSKVIKQLYLRNNNFDDNDGIILFEGVTNNRSLQLLDIAENNFSTFCGNSLKKMIEDNDSLEILDLSWNKLRLDGASSLSKGLKKNNGLKTLILNWNGFEDTGIKELSQSLIENEYLEELEIVCNRITDCGFAYILKALEKNTTLKTLKIGWNSISQSAAENSLNSLKSGAIKGCGLKVLDFTNIIFRPNFQSVIDSVVEIRTDFTCNYGYDSCYGKRKLESYDPIDEALQFMKVYIETHQINLVELFEKFDIDGSKGVTYEEFREGLKEAGIPINDTQFNQLIQYLDSDGDGEIDFSELVIGAEIHAKKEAKLENEANKLIEN